MSVIGTIKEKRMNELEVLLSDKEYKDGLTIDVITSKIVNDKSLLDTFKIKNNEVAIKEIEDTLNLLLFENRIVVCDGVYSKFEGNFINENIHNDIKRALTQITTPLSVLEQEIVVNIFRTNYRDLAGNKAASGVIDRHPGVYCFFNEKTIYIGESVHPFKRLEQHAQSGNLKNDDAIIVFRSEQFNKSVVYDIETKLIDYIGSEQKFSLRNQKTQQGDHLYFLKFAYKPIIQKIWDFLIDQKITEKTMVEIEKTDIFKFSPFKSLNSDQLFVTESIDDALIKNDVVVIKGKPGTGKSILASTLYGNLSKDHKICLTSGTINTTETFKRVFKLHNKNLSNGSKVLKTSELLSSDENFDMIIVDEAHRLSKKKSKGHPMKYAHINDNEDELKMIINKYKKAIILYDENQYVHDGDFIASKEHFTNAHFFELEQQMRASDGDTYISWIINILQNNFSLVENFGNYDFRIFDNFSEMYKELKKKSKNHPLTRLVSGYSREWISNKNPKAFDFDIDGIKLRWNNWKSVRANKWIQSEAAKKLEEVTYYNVIQGFDLDYAGVIIGNDIYLDENDKICIDEKFVKHTNQKPNSTDPFYKEKLFTWIINRYKILLSRGVYGTFVYIEDEKLRKKIESLMKID